MKRAVWERRLQAVWYGGGRTAFVLLPLSAVYCAVAVMRRLAYRAGLLPSTRLKARVVVVGNIAVGGTGKTPLVIALATRLRDAGQRVGILTRGYGGNARHWPQAVRADSDPEQVGDEAVLLAVRTGLPVFAGPDRVAAAKALLANTACDVLISDDGLQHYRLQRDVEIALVDAERGLGNGHCLPAGPLREPAARLKQTGAVVSIGNSPFARYAVTMRGDSACRVDGTPGARALAAFRGERVHAIAGLGNPRRFFAMLEACGLEFQSHAFPDHHPWRPRDFSFDDGRPVLMTEKDAVKCRLFAQKHWWYVPVEVIIGRPFEDWLRRTLQ